MKGIKRDERQEKEGKKEKGPFVVSAHFSGVNTPTLTDFKPPVI